MAVSLLALKALGAGLVLASGLGMGLALAERYARRPAELAALRVALQVLVTEIDYGLTPLPAALRRAGLAAGGPVGQAIAEAGRRLAERRALTAREALEGALAAADLALSREDQGVLLALAAVLGASGRQDQLRHLNLALRRLELAEEEARRDGERRRRLAWSLSVLGALAVVLISA